MTAATSVIITAACDRCGNPDATWLGTAVEPGGTLWEVDCPHCSDQRATFTAQLLRRRARRLTLVPNRPRGTA